ncbi:hypothetical protein [Xanthobacter flavus]|uniref:hypothetical protein n=1 Tax=Xanthobacter flavus TaxID=281 RepID=UPI003726724B
MNRLEIANQRVRALRWLFARLLAAAEPVGASSEDAGAILVLAPGSGRPLGLYLQDWMGALRSFSVDLFEALHSGSSGAGQLRRRHEMRRHVGTAVVELLKHARRPKNLTASLNASCRRRLGVADHADQHADSFLRLPVGARGLVVVVAFGVVVASGEKGIGALHGSHLICWIFSIERGRRWYLAHESGGGLGRVRTFVILALHHRMQPHGRFDVLAPPCAVRGPSLGISRAVAFLPGAMLRALFLAHGRTSGRLPLAPPRKVLKLPLQAFAGVWSLSRRLRDVPFVAAGRPAAVDVAPAGFPGELLTGFAIAALGPALRAEVALGIVLGSSAAPAFAKRF